MSVFSFLVAGDQQRYTRLTGGNPQSPQYWVDQLFGGGGSTATGIEVNEDSALSYSPVWAAVSIISGAVGMLPLPVYRRTTDAEGREGKEKASGLPVYTLLNTRPNPYMDALTFRETLQGHVLTWGNGYAEIEWGNAGAKNLWPLRPDRVEPSVEDGALVYKVSDAAGRVTRLPSESVVHVKGLGFDGLKGYSVIRYAAENLAVGMAAERFGAAFFGNSTRPSGFLSHPNELSDTAREHLKKDIESEHQGLDNAHRMMILEEGITWQQMGIPPEEAQFLETRKFGVTDVARWFSIPPHMLAELDRATFSNIEHQGMAFVTWTLGKWLRRWELELTYKVVPGSGPELFAEFLVDALMRGDTKTRFEAYAIAVAQGGWMNRNEVRAKENMNPEDGLDEFMQPLNMGTAGAAPEPEPEAEPEPAPDGAEPPEDDNRFRALWHETWDRLATKEVRALRKGLKHPDGFAGFLEDFYAKHVDHAESVLAPVMAAALGAADGARDAALDYVGERCEELRLALAGDYAGMADRVETLLATWQANTADQMTDRMLTGGKDGTP